MNDKDIFYLFLKHADIIVSRYKELTKPPVRFVTSSRGRECFDLNFAKSQQEIAKMGNSAYHCYFEKEGKEKYGVFAHIPLYKYTKWDIKIIDQYKDQLVWLLLLEYGDFMFEEELLEKYEQYIPWSEISSNGTKHLPIFDNHIYFKSGTTLSNFKNIGKLSYNFIYSHISEIDILGLCTTGNFDVTIDLVQLLVNNYNGNIISDNKSYEYNYKGDIFSYRGGLVQNKRISIPYEVFSYIAKDLQLPNWKLLVPLITQEDFTPENILDLYCFNKQCFDAYLELDFPKRRNLISLINSSKILQNTIDSDTIKTIWQGGNGYKTNYLSHYVANDKLPYTYNISVELIKKHIDSWNEQLYEYHDHMQRTPDVNYHFYKRITMWNILSEEGTFLLTYDLCKYLISIDVIIGGSYTIEDRDFLTEDIPNYPINALKLFSNRDVLNDEEFDKIIHDESIIDFLLTNSTKTYDNKNYVTGVIIDKLILKFFSDFPFEKFQELSLMYKK